MENQIEIWANIPNYEGLYQASSFGNIKSIGYKEEKILKASLTSSKYLCVVLHKNKKRKTLNVHQLVAMAFLNHTPCGRIFVVNHKNFNRLDNNINNLEIVTMRENTNQKHMQSSSQYTGVTWFKRDSKWLSQIFINGKRKHLGYYNTEIEASNAYQNALKELL
jgi:hypothetical protein